jgi:hypothetical protein
MGGCSFDRFGKIVAYFDFSEVSSVGGIGGLAIVNHSSHAFKMMAQAEVVLPIPDGVRKTGSKGAVTAEGQLLAACVEDERQSSLGLLPWSGAMNGLHSAIHRLHILR